MLDLLEQRIIFAVAQRPFEPTSSGDVVNLFGTLAPVLLEDGEDADPAEFPNAGLVWWMLMPRHRSLAVPGRLVKGTLETAIDFDQGNPAKSYYQVRRESVAPVGAEDIVELIALPADAITSYSELVGRPLQTSLNRPTAGVVLVSWRGRVLGPFSAASPSDGLEFPVTLATLGKDQTAAEASLEEFNQLVGSEVHRCTLTVSGGSQSRERSESLLRCEYSLLLPGAVKKFAGANQKRIHLETNADVLRRVGKRFLTRKRRQELTQLLDDLDGSVGGGADVPLPGELEVLQAVRNELKIAEGETLRLAGAILDAGVLDSQIEKRKDEVAQEYIEQNAVRLRAQVQDRVVELEQRHRDLELGLSQLGDDLDRSRKTALGALEEELRIAREHASRELEVDRVNLSAQQKALEDDRQGLAVTLEQLVTRFSDARKDVVGDVVAMLSALGELQLQPQRPSVAAEQSVAFATPGVLEPGPLQIPAFLLKRHALPAPTEAEFFERFRAHARNAGYSYRDVDLLTFHLSVKCGDLTVLGGASGVGKSSLPRLYNEALAGSEREGRIRFLEIAVSPSWLDTRDLLGYVNTLDHQFQPSESGLYRHLINAQSEFSEKSADSGIYLVSLDEMNLAHVEHYFGSFLQALERPVEDRRVACFDRDVLKPDGPFSKWGEITLHANVRFMGTVNFDETTRRLSLRVLDRANLIRLRSGSVSDLALTEPPEARPDVDGAPVSTRAYRSWIRTGQIPPSLAGIVDEIRSIVGAAGAGVALSPRRYRAVATFVASAPKELCSPEQALDLQIAQRVVPQIQGALRNELREVRSDLRNLLSSHGFEESLAALDEIDRAEASLLGEPA